VTESFRVNNDDYLSTPLFTNNTVENETKRYTHTHVYTNFIRHQSDTKSRKSKKKTTDIETDMYKRNTHSMQGMLELWEKNSSRRWYFDPSILPTHLRDLHNDYPMAPEHHTSRGTCSVRLRWACSTQIDPCRPWVPAQKLVPNLLDKSKLGLQINLVNVTINAINN